MQIKYFQHVILLHCHGQIGIIIIGRAAESIACYSTLAFYGTEYYIYQYFLTFTNIQDTLYIYIYIYVFTPI